jgi:membrane protein YdbS with pleckstrin-like domain
VTEPDTPNPLHPNVVIAWRVSGLLGATVWSVIVGALELILIVPSWRVIGFPGALTAVAAALAFTLALAWPALRYRYWRWRVEPDRLLIEKGVIWRSRSLVPRVRIQHVDTRTSPLQRWLGLASLVIFTAGTRGADVEIPGLADDEAVRLRDELAHLEEIDERA